MTKYLILASMISDRFLDVLANAIQLAPYWYDLHVNNPTLLAQIHDVIVDLLSLQIAHAIPVALLAVVTTSIVRRVRRHSTAARRFLVA